MKTMTTTEFEDYCTKHAKDKGWIRRFYTDEPDDYNMSDLQAEFYDKYGRLVAYAFRGRGGAISPIFRVHDLDD